MYIYKHKKNVKRRGIKRWKRRHGMTEIDGGFCRKLELRTIVDTRLDEQEEDSHCIQLYEVFVNLCTSFKKMAEA